MGHGQGTESFLNGTVKSWLLGMVFCDQGNLQTQYDSMQMRIGKWIPIDSCFGHWWLKNPTINTFSTYFQHNQNKKSEAMRLNHDHMPKERSVYRSLADSSRKEIDTFKLKGEISKKHYLLYYPVVMGELRSQGYPCSLYIPSEMVSRLELL